jgi:hypothetical protein
VWIDSGYPLKEPALTARFDEACLWWRHERLHRAVLLDYPTRVAAFAADRSEMEASFLEMVARCDASPEARRKFSQACFHYAGQALSAWLERVRALPVKNTPAFYYANAWQGLNRLAGLPEE